MLPHARSAIAVVLLAIVAFLCTSHAHSQTFNLADDRVQIAELRGLWRFHTGDDLDGKLEWADPKFDDSSWELLRSAEPWSGQGHKGYSGMAWYRFKVVLPAKIPSLAIYIPSFATSYQVYAGGRLIGQRGGLPPHQSEENGANRQVFPVPTEVVSPGNSLQIAIRVWHSPRFALFVGGGPHAPVCMGDVEMLTRYRDGLEEVEFVSSQAAGNILLIINLLAGIAALGLFILHPSDREYLWFSGFELSNAVFAAVGDYNYWYLHSGKIEGLLLNSVQTAGYLMFLVFLRTLLRQPRNFLYWFAIVSALLSVLIEVPLMLEWISEADYWIVGFALYVPFCVGVLTMLVRGVRTTNRDAALLVGPVALTYSAVFFNGVNLTIVTIGLPDVTQHFRWFYTLFTWPFPVSVQNILDASMQLSVLAILVLRFARTKRDEERLKTEFESARNVQQVLVPDEVPNIPGFAIQCVYRPAGQIGGDFFQVLPTKNGGALIVIGDVSGKGLPAAMTVSLLVGTARTLAHYTQDPAEILAAMNQRMLARSKDGFTTCLVLHIEANGTITVANAGHLAPYCGSRELVVENGLPLGLVADATYAESTFLLGFEDQITLLTDGVVEARGKNKELFGFDRAAAMAGESAEAIAHAAIAFGQEDDVTVLTLRRQMLSTEPATQITSPILTQFPA